MVRYAPLLVAALGLTACSPEAQQASAPAPVTAAAPPPVVAPPQAPEFDAVGTEPFWAVQVRKDGLRLSRPDYAEVIVTAPAPRADGDALVWTAEGLTVTVRPGACSDGMSDRRYLYLAQVQVGTEVLKGCAYKPGAAPTATPES